MVRVTLEGVAKTYPGGATAVRGVDLEVAPGELVTLVGPSGCGKSTLLDLVAGFQQPTAGHVRFDGVVVDASPPSERGVAMVFQSYALYPHMSVRRNIGFPLEVARVSAREIDARVAAMAERLGLGALLDRKPKELSGGQRQRVALGRALVRKPKLCLLDEPLSNLDASLRVQMRAEIKKLHEETGATFLYVTHDHEEAMTLSDRMVVLARGEIQQIAPPREVYRRPSNTFVATFVGSPPMNLLPADALGLGDRAPGDAARLLAGVRPEAITVGQGEAPPGAVTGLVYVATPLGSHAWITLDLGRGVKLVGRAPPELEPTSGERAWACWEPSAVHWFDRTTEQRVANRAPRA
jgi:multiple sugar transport system ATP-binding protein